ncbi:hypothetical protein SPSYN_01102 [Sporotomaculum syntrophicum]|uniref:SWIM-type domain-containing protein n=1 Tax=Sporotomaculum syntrophicum TaxID=182264 RepID=A0A9D2WQB0_9FIRM|nr:SWIM zinc finger family protein [Sporotomaculum syntrophicum]KAF1084966.1 hypothetical protein SPSYN_01102 [Sporotomaculum syntrophicum]
MLRRLLSKVDNGRFGRALAGWQWECKERHDGLVEGYVEHGSKRYMVIIGKRGRRYFARCACEDAVKRGVLCKHIAFAAMSELGLAAARSAHRRLPRLGAEASFFLSCRCPASRVIDCLCTRCK